MDVELLSDCRKQNVDGTEEWTTTGEGDMASAEGDLAVSFVS